MQGYFTYGTTANRKKLICGWGTLDRSCRSLRFCFLLSVLFLSACSATGPLYSEYQDKLPPINDNNARIYVYRSGLPLGPMQSARVTADGAALGICDANGFNVFDVPASEHTLAVDIPGQLGTCAITIDVESGRHYYYEITPRYEIGLWGAAGAIVLGPAFGSGFFDLLGGMYLGLFGGTVIPECGGEFSIEPVGNVEAEEALFKLRLSEDSNTSSTQQEPPSIL